MMIDQFINQVFHDDVLHVLRRLPDNSVDMIYGDPDYNVGIDYAGRKYTQTWDDYIKWYCTLAQESMRVLKPTGNLFFINYPKQNAYLRVYALDKLAYDVHDYVWIYNTNIGHSPRRFTRAHRSILHATKSKHNHFYKDQVAQPYLNPHDKRIRQRLQQGHPGRMPYSWLYFDLVKNTSRDKTSHPCQIPLGLVRLLIQSCTKEHDIVFILFGGSGSEILLCHTLRRYFISTELHRPYYDLIISRLRSTSHSLLPIHSDSTHHDITSSSSS